ncbi:MAG: DMT family transporter [Proteobacteria bacterium]|nr:MAG: DMT family transporter [Pseudomonadota bacterium]QKK11485.1 MAG: DMT family transporter [Pseudomonadota bacterium]
MTPRTYRADALLLLAALIWGTGFVAQRLGMESVGPMLFNALRFTIGALVLLPWAIRAQRFEVSTHRTRDSLNAGLLAGGVLFIAAGLQQAGLLWTSVANAGFITGLYVLFVPLLGLLASHRTPTGTWTGAILAVVGLYFLSVTEDLAVSLGDGLQLLGAVFWAVHVLVLGRYSRRVPVITLACVQFAVCALLSLAAALVFEPISLAGIGAAMDAVLYSGLLAVGVGYTLQVVGQRNAPAAHAAILLSLEAVFAALAGWIVLNEGLSWRGVLGGALMLAGMLIAQLAPLLTRRRLRAQGLPAEQGRETVE